MFGSFLILRLFAQGDPDGDSAGGNSGGGGDSGNSNGAIRRSDAKQKAAFKAAGRTMTSEGDSLMSGSRSEAASHIGPVSYKRGGRVKKTGLARLHKNELVVPAKKRKKVQRMMKRKGKRGERE
jgi:hypothetical protein